MRLIYEGTDITKDVEINKAMIVDTSGGEADSLEIRFSDTQRLWSKWRPEKNHRIELNKQGFSSGEMYIDAWEQIPGFFVLKALSLPQEAKTTFSRSWEEVRLFELVNEVAARYKLGTRTFGINNHFYKRLDQINKTDIEFLAWRCSLEGYSLKVTDKTIVIFDERTMEKSSPVKTIYHSDFDGDYIFWDQSTEIFSACRLQCGPIRVEARDSSIHGPIKKIAGEFYVSSIGEAERFAAGILRRLNKNRAGGTCRIRYEPGLAAGNMVEIKDVGLADGLYYCEKVTHNLTAEITKLELRRPLEGY